MFNNVDELIEKANLIDNDEERLRYVLNYFLETVQYDYAYLLIGGFLHDEIEVIQTGEGERNVPIVVPNIFKKGKVTLTRNGEKIDFDDSYCTTWKIAKGKSKLLEKIVDKAQQCSGDQEKFLICLSKIFEDELKKHLEKEELVLYHVNKIMENVRNEWRNGIISNVGEKKYIVCPDIKKVLLTFVGYCKKYFPCIIENGLMKSGVCENFSDYFVNLLPKIGIDTVKISGTSELKHAWNAVILDGKLKSIDLTRALFIRDGYKGIPENQKSSDWLIADFKDTFKMQKTRTITGVGTDEKGESKKLDEIIDGSNYNKDKLRELVMQEIHNKTK